MVEYTWKDFARALALAESLVDVASEEPPPSDAALRDEVCMAHAVVAADIIIERLERERDEWKRKYEVQCAGSWSSAGERASLRAKLDTLTKELEAARNVCEAAGVVIDDTRNASYADCCVNKGKVCDLLAAIAAYRATQTKEPRDEAK